MSGIDLKARNLLRNIIGWGLYLLAALFFVASILPLAAGDYGPFATGLVLSFLVLLSGLEVKTDKGKMKKRIVGLMSAYFPKCPICKSDVGYENRGWWSFSQNVRCKNCGAQWTSNDFIGYKDLKVLKLQEPPEDPKVYGEFMSQSTLKPRKPYHVKSWQSSMKGQETQIQMKGRHLRVKGFILLHRREAGCFAISLGASILAAAVGYQFFSLDMGQSYILFVGTFFAVLMDSLVLLKRA